MASPNKRPVGFRHCTFRSSYGVSRPTLFQRGEKHSSDTGVINSVLRFVRRGKSTIRKEFYRICTSRKTKRGVLFHILSGGKETIRIKTNSESKTTKPDDKEAMFQNRNSAVCQKSSEIRGLAVFNRPKRRLHAHSSLGRPWDRGKSVPISGDSIWANVSPSSFHKDTSPSPVVAKARMEGVHVFPYLDDLLIRALSSQAEKDVQTLLVLLESCGFLINQEKSIV